MITHAFFKALLFLGAGSVIHGMDHEQDMRYMGALRKVMPITASTFIVGWLAIAGVPPFAGFWSKDEILLYSLAKSPALYVIGLVTALLTAYYMTRQVIMVFYGQARWESHAEEHGAHGEFKPHESPPSMLFPLVVLALLSTVGGLINLPAFSWIPDNWQGKLSAWLAPVVDFGEAEIGDTTAYDNKGLLAFVAIAVALAGIIAAYAIYYRRVRKPIEPAILEEGWKYDQLVTAFMGGPGRKAFDAIAWFDRTIIDGAVMGAGRTVARTAGQLRKGQTGNIRNYAEIVGVGVVLLLAWFVIGRGIL
jgi:NADH-quinone oxidoreductase subunit L